jgi:hypothetical protein
MRSCKFVCRYARRLEPDLRWDRRDSQIVTASRFQLSPVQTTLPHAAGAATLGEALCPRDLVNAPSTSFAFQLKDCRSQRQVCR